MARSRSVFGGIAALRRGRGIAGLCLLLAVIHTWPLATDPGTLSRNDNGDAELNEWALAWVAHQLPRAPLRLFDANIFYPERDTLAYSEPLIVPALMGAPLYWAGCSPVFLFNIVLILGFALTAWAGYAVVLEWTRDRTAALVAGSAFAFNTHTLTRLAHVQGIHAWGLPLTLLAADRLVVQARWRDAIWLAVWMAAMAYTSGYLVVFGAILVAVVVLARVPEWLPRALTVLTRFAFATALAALMIVPVYLPYRRLETTMGMKRSLEAVAEFSATPLGYLASGSRVHFETWSKAFARNPVDFFFPGVVVIALTLLAIYWAVRAGGLTARRMVMLVALAVTGFVLSLGVQTPIYGWLYHAFPPMQGLRAAARFGNLFLLALACLAGVGVASVRSRLSPRRGFIVAVILLVLVNLEALRAPLFYTRFKGVPPVYSLLAHEPGPVVLVEVPFWPASAVFENGEYLVNSTAHWRPLMNGYSGYTPPSYRDNAQTFWYFPREHAIEAMRRAGVTHVMIHPDHFAPNIDEMWQAVAASPYLERIALTPGGPSLYRLK
jgi:hypothetical protein